MKHSMVVAGILFPLVFASCFEDQEPAIQGNPDSAVAYNGEEAPDGGPRGLGAVCESDNSCKGFEANYCVVVPNLGGYCSFKDCTTAPDNCPGGYLCCDYSIDGYPNTCLSPAKWKEYSAIICANAH